MRAPKVFTAPTKTVVRPAGKKGRGVFAAKAIRKGETIEVAPALLIPKAEADDFLSGFLAHYIFKTDHGGRYVIALGFASLFNHAATANAEFYVQSTSVRLVASKAIAKDTEITLDYGWTHKEWASAGTYIP